MGQLFELVKEALIFLGSGMTFASLQVSRPDHSLLCMFICFVLSGCDLSGHSMLYV